MAEPFIKANTMTLDTIVKGFFNIWKVCSYLIDR